MIMASLEERVNCVLWLAENLPLLSKEGLEYKKEAPHRNSISNWMNKFKETSSVNDKSRSDRPYVNEETVEEIFQAKSKKVIKMGITRAEAFKDYCA